MRGRKARLECGIDLSKEKASKARDRLVFDGASIDTLARNARDRMRVTEIMKDTADRNAGTPRMVASLVGLDEANGEEVVLAKAELRPKSVGAVGRFCDEVEAAMSGLVGCKLELVDRDDPFSSKTVAGSEVTWVQEDGIKTASYAHPERDEMLESAKKALRGMDVPDIDALRAKFGFLFPMPPDEQPVDPAGKQMAKRLLPALEDYMGDDREEVLEAFGQLVGLGGLSTNEARFVIASLDNTRPGHRLEWVMTLPRYDKHDAVTRDGIICLGQRDEFADKQREDASAKRDGAEAAVEPVDGTYGIYPDGEEVAAGDVGMEV